MKTTFRELSYEISTDPEFLDELNAIPPALGNKINHFHELANAGKRSSVQKLLNAIEQYPDNLTLKNYLSILYEKLGDTEKVYEMNRRIRTEHPDYLFGRLNHATEYYLNGEYDKMPALLGEDMELRSLYPERDTFHINEVICFFRATVQYFTAVGNVEQAQIRYDIMNELLPDSPHTELAMKCIMMAYLKESLKKIKEEQESAIKVRPKEQKMTGIIKAPIFNHQEIEWLYHYDLDQIGEEKLNTILSLPRETLIQDLELVLQDSIDRYGHFCDLLDHDEIDDDGLMFVVHAVCLLGELEATESLEAIFNMLSQSTEYIDFYHGEFLGEVFWEPVYKLAKDNLEPCKQFIFRPNVYILARTLFFRVAKQLVLHQPDKRAEVLQWYKDIIEFFLKSKLEDNVIDSEVNAYLIWNLMDLEATELAPDIQKLFEKEMVAKGICGDWPAVKEGLNTPNIFDKKNEILSIAARYKNIASTWHGYKNRDSHSNKDFRIEQVGKKEIAKSTKIGRNEACPCGSGKKYKKCCLKNN